MSSTLSCSNVRNKVIDVFSVAILLPPMIIIMPTTARQILVLVIVAWALHCVGGHASTVAVIAGMQTPGDGTAFKDLVKLENHRALFQVGQVPCRGSGNGGISACADLN